jgi:hypothetical protein
VHSDPREIVTITVTELHHRAAGHSPLISGVAVGRLLCRQGSRRVVELSDVIVLLEAALRCRSRMAATGKQLTDLTGLGFRADRAQQPGDGVSSARPVSASENCSRCAHWFAASAISRA